MPKSVSVIIPTYNYGRFIADSIRSAINQTHAPTEIIVVDDGSADNTEELVVGFGESVRYFRQDNAGVCAARNRGVNESSGTYIAFLDADDIWEPTKTEKQLARFDEGVGLVHCGLQEFDSETGEILKLTLTGGEQGVAEKLLLWETPSVNVSGSVVMVSREAFDEVGGFDTQMKVGEDWDFCYRVAREFDVRFVAEPLVNYRIHGSAAHHNVAEMERGMLRFYKKAFADPSITYLRRKAYGNFHKVMAGSYFHGGNYFKFFSHATRGVLMRPSNLGYFLMFPVRKLKADRNPVAVAPGSDVDA